MLSSISAQTVTQPFKQIYAGAMANKKIVAITLVALAAIAIAAIAIGAAYVAPFAVTLPVGGVMIASISAVLITYLWKQGRNAS